MDEAVLRAIAKWPDVPAVYGWLRLDRRGQWLIKGDKIRNPGVTAFMGRNYAADDLGRWYFQNGPQRVFVSLEYTPFVIETAAGDAQALATHTGLAIPRVSGAWVDETGALLLRWAGGPGVMSDRDLAAVSTRFTDARGERVDDDTLARAFDPDSRRHASGVYFQHAGTRVPVGRIQSVEVAQKFGFDPDPRPAEGEPEC